MSKVTIDQVLGHLATNNLVFEFNGPFDLVFDSIRALSEPAERSISFYRGIDTSVIEELNLSKRLLVVKSDVAGHCATRDNILALKNPDLAMCYIGELFETNYLSGVHPTAVIHRDADIHENSSVAANVVIGENVVVGSGVRIEEGAVIKHCIIGENTHIFPGVKIGSSGLGSHRDERGAWHHFPHWGRVVIGSNVTIQDNCVIARGTLNETILENGVVIGPLSWIAHGVKVKKNVLIGQSVTVAGSVIVGEGSIIWGNASVRDAIMIGVNCTIGMGAVVVNDVPDNVTVLGNPARPK